MGRSFFLLQFFASSLSKITNSLGIYTQVSSQGIEEISEGEFKVNEERIEHSPFRLSLYFSKGCYLHINSFTSSTAFRCTTFPSPLALLLIFV